VTAAGKIFGTVGALAAFPRRLAAKEVARRSGTLTRGVTRRTTHLVFGRTLLGRSDDFGIETKVDAGQKAGRKLLSENGFLRLLGLMKAPEASELTRQSLLDQSKLSPRDFDLLSLFDAFEHHAEPYSFRDLILARKYAGLIAGGASWGAIARSVHRSGPIASLTAKSLHVEAPDAIYARLGENRSELNGQLLFDLGSPDEAELEDGFVLAEQAEQEGRYEEAAELYRRCMSIDPGDAILPFNRGNCLRAAGRRADAAHDYARAIKLDPGFVEAWFNLAGLTAERGHYEAARRHFLKAIGLDAAYADAVFNLAKLEFDAGNLAEARRWWSRYLELDAKSEWARTASRGIRFVDLQLAQRTAG
jgi:tetratricopeptide (TPR) repeat protein